MKSAVVIIPTTGADTLLEAVESILNQDYQNITILVVIDGKEFEYKTLKLLDSYIDNINILCLPENTGANGWYGHRIYAACSYLVNQDFVLFLDQDNWFKYNHVSSMIETLEETNSDWVYSLRDIYSKAGEFIVSDNCESLGKWKAWTNCFHIDTNCYCLTKDVAIKIASAWYGKWGQDRIVFQTLINYFPKYDCTNKYTVNYRLDGNLGSVTKEFFEEGNKRMSLQYNNKLPWTILI